MINKRYLAYIYMYINQIFWFGMSFFVLGAEWENYDSFLFVANFL